MTAVCTTCPYCGVGCGVVVSDCADDADARVNVAGDKAHPANFGRLCSKGSALAETLDLDGRLLHPLVGGERVSWDRALDLVARKFADVIAVHGPKAVAFYASGQLLTEDYYVANKLMKGFIGSANIDTNSRLCMASAVAGYKRALGADFVPNSYADIEQAELLVITGSNMAWCHPVLFQRARQAKLERPDLAVVVIDPRRTATCDIADLHLPIRPGTDVVLFNGLLCHVHREKVIDWRFVGARTEGFTTALRVAEETAPSAARVASICGVAEADIVRFYRLFARSRKAVTLFSQGVNQSTSGTDKVNSIINAHLATGRIGKPGTGPFSLTGQPNAMGGREVGGLANQLAAHMDFEPVDVDRVARFWGSRTVATQPGLKAVELFDAIGRGEVKAVWIMSTNPVVSMPDADAVKLALERCECVVVSDCMRETDTTACGDILLPAATWGEKSGTVTNSERRISRQRAFMPAPGEARPDWWIVSQVAKRLGYGKAFAYRTPAEIFREHASLSAFENDGTRDFDIGALATLSEEEYDGLEPVCWPAPAGTSGAAGVGGRETSRFYTRSGKAQFVATRPRPPARSVDERFPYLLVTGRVRDQWHTMTRTGKSPRLSQTKVEPFVEVHPADALAIGLVAGGIAKLTSDRGSMQARVDVSDGVRRGEVFVPMHWSAQFARLGRVGSLIDAAVDPQSGQPELKATPVRVERIDPAWTGFALSRTPLAHMDEASYSVCSRGGGYWRYELAGDAAPGGWAERARQLLGDGGEWIEYADTAAGRYRAARLTDDRLDACLFVTPAQGLPDRGWLGSLFAEEALGDAERLSLLAARPADASAIAGPLICSCFAVGRETLIDAIRSQRMTSAAEIGRVLKAGTNCGSCIPELNGLIDEARDALDEAQDALGKAAGAA